MEQFITWDMLAVFTTLITIVYMVVEFVKELTPFKLIKTKYLSFLVAFLLIAITNLVMRTFEPVDLILYALSSISISLSANGLYDFNKKVLDERE